MAEPLDAPKAGAHSRWCGARPAPGFVFLCGVLKTKSPPTVHCRARRRAPDLCLRGVRAGWRHFFALIGTAPVFLMLTSPVLHAATPNLIWSDEFALAPGSAPDPTKWVHDIGGGGWGNRELETYTDSRE